MLAEIKASLQATLNGGIDKSFAAIKEFVDTDALSGLYHHQRYRSDLEWLKASMGKHAPAAYVFVEIDKFKNVNSEIGHNNADEMLKAVAQIMNEAGNNLASPAADPAFDRPAIPSNYVRAYHRSGDEFFLLLIGSDKAQIENLCRTILHDVADFKKEFIVNGTSVTSHVTVSIAIAMVDRLIEFEADEMEERAEIAMQYAKIKRNEFRFYETTMVKNEQNYRLEVRCVSCSCSIILTIPESLHNKQKAFTLTCPNPECKKPLEFNFGD
jgi:GGDEF domain-containing protein